jgi:GNAT superfamily N-acetyltransferase
MRALAVHPSARGQRLGERLVEVVVEWATAANATQVTLSTTPFLTASRRLYERCGFVVDDTRAGGDLHGTPLIALVRHLADGAAE